MEEPPVGRGPRRTLNAGGLRGNRFDILRRLVLASWILSWTGGCGDDPGQGFAPRPPETPSSQAESKAPESEAPSRVASGDLFLRVSRGAILRRAPESGAEALDMADEDGLSAVEESRGEFHRVTLDGRSGWVKVGSKARLLRMRSTRLPPQDAVAPSPEVLERASAAMDNPRHRACGAYVLVTDVPVTDVPGSRLPELCSQVATGLDSAFAERYGVKPKGSPREALLIFHRRDGLRQFVSGQGGPRRGYAGHAQGSDGYLAMTWGEPATDEQARTLVHEMTHLVARRALGTPLPRWLSEGLADGLGDPATLSGLGPIDGLRGAEAQARRVLERPELPDLAALTARDVEQFDRDPSARDYEQSAVFVRFLMSEPERRKRFRVFLQGVAAGEPASAEQLVADLAVDDWRKLDRELRAWLQQRVR